MDQRTASVACIWTEKQQQTIKVESTMNALLKVSCEEIKDMFVSQSKHNFWIYIGCTSERQFLRVYEPPGSYPQLPIRIKTE